MNFRCHTVRAVLSPVAAATALAALSCEANVARSSDLSAEAKAAGEAHLELIDRMVEASKVNRSDCGAMATALDEVLADHASLWLSRTHRAELAEHYEDRAVRRLQRISPFIYPCLDNAEIRNVLTSIQKGQIR